MAVGGGGVGGTELLRRITISWKQEKSRVAFGEGEQEEGKKEVEEEW